MPVDISVIIPEVQLDYAFGNFSINLQQETITATLYAVDAGGNRRKDVDQKTYTKTFAEADGLFDLNGLKALFTTVDELKNAQLSPDILAVKK